MSEQAGGNGFDAEGRLVPGGEPVTDGEAVGDQADTHRVAPSSSAQGDAPQRPSYTLSEAADLCGVDRRTIRRHLDADRFPNAWREDDGNGPWRIPVTDLLAAGLQPGKPSPPDPPTTDVAPEPDHVDRLRDRLADAERRAAVAEAVAAERDRTIRAMEAALRALEAGPATPVDEGELEDERRRRIAAESALANRETPGSSSMEFTATEPRRRWWRRGP